MTVTEAPPERVVESARSGRDIAMGIIERYALVILFGLTLIFFSVWSKTSSTFTTKANIQNVLGNQAVIGILAMAIILPLACAEFDFSVGSVAGLTQVLCAGFMARLGAPLVVALLASVAIGALIGLSNGNTVARIGVNSLIVTLGVSTVLGGVVLWYTKGLTQSNGISQSLINAGSGNWFGIPRTLYYLLIVAAVIYYVLEHTPFGRYLYSIGSNREAARLVGLPVERLVLSAFVLSGMLAGLAGVLLVARNGTASPQVGTINDSLQALAAAFLGATAIKPGRFNVIGTLVAIFFLAFTVTGLSLAGVANWINDVFNGAALFVAVLISTIIGRSAPALHSGEMRLVIATCTVDYVGRLTAHLPEATRLLLLKADGSISIHADDRAYKPLNWMSPPCTLVESDGRWTVTNPKGESLVISIAAVHADHSFELGAEPGLAKDGVEAHLQALLAANPGEIEPGLLLIRREHPTDIGPVDLLCADASGGTVAIEIKRHADIDGVEQLVRYLERLGLDPRLRPLRGILAAQSIKPQARTLAGHRGITCVVVDYDRLRGVGDGALRLF